MNKRDFGAALNRISTKGRLSLRKVAALPDDAKAALVFHIIRNRGPVVVELLPASMRLGAPASTFDHRWLNSMGYLYTTKGAKSGFTFRHTCEHTIN